MDDKGKEMEKKIREFDRQQLLTELRFKKLKELDEARTAEPRSKANVKRAEERALEAYPISIQATQLYGDWDINKTEREGFAKGYEQAEKDLAPTWEDMRRIIRIDEEMMEDPEAHPEWMEEQPYYEEILKRYLEAKK